MPIIEYGVLVLGAGPAGENAADIAARNGLRVAIIEGDLVGTDGPVTASVSLLDGTAATIEADEVLVATGRRPNTRHIGLETVGLEVGRFIGVDDHLLARMS